MKPGQLPGSVEKFSRSRRALAQPRFLLAAMALTLSGVVYLATAQTGRAPVKMTSNSSKSYSLKDLPAMVAAYGQSRQPKAASPISALSGGFSAAAIGTGQSGYNLVETDLTPNTPSDEREAAYSPGGDFIAFMSTGKDSNGDGTIDSDGINAEKRYHIWVMNRDGSDAHQVTGLIASDKPLAQSHPAWSPDGNQLVYINNPGANSQLNVVDLSSTGFPNQQRTFFAGEKRAPVWSPSGLAIAFACKGNPDRDTTVSADATSTQYDIFTIPPSGSINTKTNVNNNLIRLTGGKTDVLGNKTQDLNPTFASVNNDVMYFSSDRDYAGRLTNGGRRIWRMSSSGANKVPVTDPSKRAYGLPTDIDDYPTASLDGSVTERLAFHSNTALSANDTTKDYNIWALPLSSAAQGTFFTETEPRVFASDFSGNQIQYADPLTGAANLNPDQPITGVENPEGVVVQGQYVYIANRGTGQIVRFFQESGLPAPAFGRAGISFSDADTVPDAAGMIGNSSYFYVAAGINTSGKPNTVALYRFSAATGAMAGTTATSAAFSSGEDTDGAITNGTEGLCFSPNQQYIFASIYSDNKINVYETATGKFITTIVKKQFPGSPATANPNAPNGPTGLTFGPDLNGDGFRDLYVNASAGDQVIAYMGPSTFDITAKVGPTQTNDPGTYITTLVSDTNGTQTNLNAPEGIYIAQRDATNYYLYVSSFQNRGFQSNRGTGDHINRYNIKLNTPSLPTVTTAARAGLSNDASITDDAVWLRFEGAQGIGYFAFNQLAANNLGAGALPAATPTPVPVTAAIETTGDALVVTNILSSPENYAASGLKDPTPDVGGTSDNKGVVQDKADDLEPNFSRADASAPLSARLVFSSSRRYAPVPASNVKDTSGNIPAPSNPYGYNENTKAQGTFDIWGTSTQDTTPPAIIPQPAGNGLYPVVAPGPQAPFNAPREYDAGLRPSTSSTPSYVQVAVVISDQESGLSTGVLNDFTNTNSNAVTVSFRQAGKELFEGYNTPPFTGHITRVDANIPVQTAPEQRPNFVKGAINLPLQPYDDGPIGSGGHERQAGAIAGDGIYYCYNRLKTPTASGDFFMDIDVKDQAGNTFNFDNVWGFSTSKFQKPSTGNTDLFVSDYTGGQAFPYTLSGDGRFADMLPCESYWLSNPGGQAFDDPDPTKRKVIAISVPQTFDNVDVWRTQCRGPVPTTVLDSYRPNTTTQIDPNETTPGPDGPFTEKSRVVAVADSSVIWAAPYAGTVFTGPGTIIDSDTQTNLTAFLDKGGRLFLSGRDIARSLTNEGGVTNNFLSDEMAAQFESEVATNVITHVEGGDFLSNVVYHEDDLANLEIPYHYTNPQTADYTDASLNQTPIIPLSTGVPSEQGNKMDVFSAQSGNGITTTPAYTVGGRLVGQRIEKVRSSGLKSRAVFFGFGLEAVNRRYRVATPPSNPLTALDDRYIIGRQIRQYFKTGSLTGRVTNSSTNLPIANFLVLVTGGGDTYLARTDANGTYLLNGLSPGGYTVQPALLLNGVLVPYGTKNAVTSPGGFFGGTSGAYSVSGGALTSNANLQLTQLSPGTIQGSIRASQGTPTDFSDDALDAKSVGVPVLLRSVDESSAVKGGGHFAALTQTDAGGNFSFSNVPSQIELELIVNPNVDDPSTAADEGDIPSESGLRDIYRNNFGGPRLALGRRILPDSRHPEPVIAPVGNTFVLNDPDPAKYPDPDNGPAAGSANTDVAADSGVKIIVPEGAPVSGQVNLNGAPFAGANVELLDASGQPLPIARSVGTGSDGKYNFVDVVVGTYVVRASATVSGITVSKSVTVTQKARVVNKPPTGVTANFSLFIAKITGKVTVNGQIPSAKAQVKLYYQDGTVFRPERKATTDAAGGYIINTVPAGDYLLRATLGAASGSVNITVSATKDLVAPTIDLVSRSVSGSVKTSVNGGTATGVSGIVVNLLNTAGTAIDKATTDSSGNYIFAAVSSGTYSVTATYLGQTLTSANFTVSASKTTAPTLTFAFQTITVTVKNSAGGVQANASLTLTQNQIEFQTGLTDSKGQYVFTNVVAGAYNVAAAFDNLTGNADITVVKGKALSITITLAQDTAGPTTYSGKGKIFYISLPYEDANGPSSNNGANRTGSATTSIQSAFTVPPFDASTGAQNYLLQRYDPLTNKFVTLDNTASIERGAGYILQILNKGTNQVLPAADPTRVGLRDSRFKTTYTVTLRLNPSNRGSSDNGLNLIGFGFDPSLYSSVDWATAVVTLPDGTSPGTVKDAANLGYLVDQITTSEYVGNTLTTVAVDSLKPFKGYYVQTKVDGLKITFVNPTP